MDSNKKRGIIMKLDIDYIKRILIEMENADTVIVYSKDLFEALNTEASQQDESMEKFIKHILDLRDLGAIVSKNHDMGFIYGANGHLAIYNTWYRLTPEGQRLLDVMKNDNWWTKIKSMGKEITFDTLKQAPAIILTKYLSCL